jgi:hypothetical protein
MKATFLRTWVAVAVLAGLGAYIYFVESKKPAADEKKKEKLFTLDKSKAREIDIRPREGEAVRLVKEGGTWKMTEPQKAVADDQAADSLVTSFEGLEVDETVVEQAAHLADYGLEKPVRAVTIRVDGVTEPFTLDLGDKTPDGSGVYAKLPSKPRVFTVASYVESSFDKKPFDLRDRSLLHLKRDDVRAMEIAGPDGAYALARNDKGEWAFTKPVVTRAGRWAVDGLLGSLESLKMDKIAAEDPKDLTPFGLASPARTVSLVLAAGGSRKLEIGSGAEEGKYHAREASSTVVGVIPPAVVDDLAKGMKNLRETRLQDVSTYDVQSFDVESPGAGKKTFVRSTEKDKDGIEVSKWKRTAPDAKDIDTNKVQDALFKIGGTDVQEFVDEPGPAGTYGLDTPALKVSVRYEKDKPPTWLEVGKKDGQAYARRPDDAAVLKLDPAKADELIKAFAEL